MKSIRTSCIATKKDGWMDRKIDGWMMCDEFIDDE